MTKWIDIAPVSEGSDTTYFLVADAEGNVPDLCIVNCECITSPCVAIPDVGGDPNVYLFFTQNRSSLASLWNAHINDLHENNDSETDDCSDNDDDEDNKDEMYPNEIAELADPITLQNNNDQQDVNDDDKEEEEVKEDDDDTNPTKVHQPAAPVQMT